MCLLKKAIYGLKQSPRAWFHKFSQLLFSYGFVSTVSDPTVMQKRTPHGCVILAVYVDDIIITGSDDVEVIVTKAYLAQHFVTRDLSPPRYFLGLEIAYRPGQMSICQRKYVLDLLEETGMLLEESPALLEDAGLYLRRQRKYGLLTDGVECGLVGQCYCTSRGCRPLPPTCGEIDLPHRDSPGHLLCG